MSFYWLAEPFLYTCLAVLFGFLIMPRIHPVIQTSTRMINWALLGIVICAFVPVLRIIVFFANDTNWFIIFRSVMFSFAEGKAYVWTLIFCILLLMMIRINNTNKNRHLYTAALVLTAIGLIATLSWSSHSSSYFGMQGFWNHLIHLLSVTVWSGILIVTSRMMPNHEKHWRSFLSWYHPFAAAIMVVILMSGLMLNVKTDPDYINSWVTSYGQALLMKHLLMIPLLIMAFFNGFIMKKRLGQEQFNPQRWLMLEGILVLLIYTVTGFLNQQPAPHELNPETMKLSASGLYTFWNQGNPITYPVHWNIDAIAILMYLLAAVSILAMYVILKKNKNTYAALVCGVLFCLVSFAGLIHAIA